MANPLFSRTRTFTCTRPQGEAEGNSTQRHKGTKDTKFRKDRTKVQKRRMANPLLSRTRTRTCTRPQGGAKERGIQHKSTRAQRTQSSEKIELRFRSGEWPIPGLFLLITNYKLRITAHGVGGRVRSRGRNKNSESASARKKGVRLSFDFP